MGAGGRALTALLVLYAAGRVLQAFPSRVPIFAITAFHVIPPLLFAIGHGAMRYGLRHMLVFTLLCAAIGNCFENLSILTGFPFGHYHFTEVMGPKLWHVPILLGLAYVGMGYLSWTLGLLLVNSAGTRRLPRFSGPVIAAALMVAWDLAMDPVWANLAHAWIWHDGGAYFGVPWSNFFGWFLTAYLIFQSFAIYLWMRRRNGTPEERALPAGYWRLAVLFYAVSAVGNLLVIPPPGLKTVIDASGRVWRVSGIRTASAVVSVFVMGGFAWGAWVKADRETMGPPA